jgi:hypothetical protein
MKVLITEDKLQSLFNSMMLEFDNLYEHERDYDYYDYNKNTYIDYSPLNFYNRDEDDDDSWWEDDDWVFQYAENPPYNEPVDGFQTPILIYSKYYFKSMLEMFGSKFNDLLKVWFESTYDYPIKQVIDDYSADKFVLT